MVEDNKTNQLLMTAILKRQGLQFDIANDGQEAVTILTQPHQYSLVLMDENMPNLNGIEATKQIRTFEQLHGLKPLPIIALTANAMTGDRERFLAAGMNEYLTKPINIPALMDLFAVFLTSDVQVSEPSTLS
ncbi:response regulator [Thiomicrorhabdus aquaedulcis]|uniref:response regulator n=1 Tax=Thiomicrorhabdus aquaedulcis TaxID=2211106 RepID=UPI000FD86582|nr:response regulator [Thiomicrorhabdus aquaedulcis]